MKGERTLNSRHSPDAHLRALARARAKQEQSFYLSLYAQLILDEALYKRELTKLQLDIDEALKNGERNKFYRLSKKYQAFIR